VTKITDDDSKHADLTKLYNEHGDELRRFLLGVLRDRSLAEDALQAGFSKLTRRIKEVQSGSIKSWLFKTALNEALGIRRKLSVDLRARRSLRWITEESSPPSYEEALHKEKIAAVRKAILDLPKEEQRIIRLRINEDITFDAISRRLKIPLGTVLGRMRAALGRLRKKLAQIGES